MIPGWKKSVIFTIILSHITHSTFLGFLESNLPGSYQDAIEILAGSCQDLHERTVKECAHRVLISRPSVYELNSLPGWTVPCYQEWVHVWSSVFQAQKFSLVWIFRKTSNTQKAIQNWKGFLRDCNYLTTHVIWSSLSIIFFNCRPSVTHEWRKLKRLFDCCKLTLC